MLFSFPRYLLRSLGGKLKLGLETRDLFRELSMLSRGCLGRAKKLILSECELIFEGIKFLSQTGSLALSILQIVSSSCGGSFL